MKYSICCFYVCLNMSTLQLALGADSQDAQKTLLGGIHEAIDKEIELRRLEKSSEARRVWRKMVKNIFKGVPIPDDEKLQSKIVKDFRVLIGQYIRFESPSKEQIKVWESGLHKGILFASKHKFSLFDEKEMEQIHTEFLKYVTIAKEELLLALSRSKHVRIPEALWRSYLPARIRAARNHVIEPAWVDFNEFRGTLFLSSSKERARASRDFVIDNLIGDLANDTCYTLRILNNAFAANPNMARMKSRFVKFNAAEQRERIRAWMQHLIVDAALRIEADTSLPGQIEIQTFQARGKPPVSPTQSDADKNSPKYVMIRLIEEEGVQRKKSARLKD